MHSPARIRHPVVPFAAGKRTERGDGLRSRRQPERPFPSAQWMPRRDGPKRVAEGRRHAVSPSIRHSSHPAATCQARDRSHRYSTHSGTSMAAPHATGGTCSPAQRSAATSPELQEAAFESGAVDLGTAGTDDAYGFGRLDVAGAYPVPPLRPASASRRRLRPHPCLRAAWRYSTSMSPASTVTPATSPCRRPVVVVQANWNLGPCLIPGAPQEGLDSRSARPRRSRQDLSHHHHWPERATLPRHNSHASGSASARLRRGDLALVADCRLTTPTPATAAPARTR